METLVPRVGLRRYCLYRECFLLQEAKRLTFRFSWNVSGHDARTNDVTCTRAMFLGTRNQDDFDRNSVTVNVYRFFTFCYQVSLKTASSGFRVLARISYFSHDSMLGPRPMLLS